MTMVTALPYDARRARILATVEARWLSQARTPEQVSVAAEHAKVLHRLSAPEIDVLILQEADTRSLP